jgi:tetratricopeptide (TPR) repeat protein
MTLKPRNIALLSVLFLMFSEICGAQNIDSLQALIASEKDDVKKVTLYHALGEAFMKSNLDSSVYYLEQAIVISRNLRNDSLVAQSYSRTGRIYIYAGVSDRGLEYLFESLRLFEKLGDSRKRIAVLNNIGAIYYRNNDLDKALAQFLDIEKIIEADKEALGDYYYTIHGNLQNNIGIIYDNRKESDKALQVYMKGLMMSQKVSDASAMGNLYTNIGKAYQLRKQYSLAETNLEEAYRIRKEQNDQYGITRSIGHLGSLYLELGDLKKAQEFLEKSLAGAEEIRSLDTQASTAEVLYEVYEKQGDYKKAFEMLRFQKALNDSLKNDRVAKRLVEVEMKYQLEKKQREETLAREKRELWYFIGAGLLIAITVIAVLLLFLQRIRANNEKLQKDNLALANMHLTLEKKTLEENLEYKNKELTTNVMYLMKKNEMLIEVSERLMEVKRNARKDDQDRIQRIILELNTAKDNDVWEEFEVRFNHVYNDFYERLTTRFPNISPNDRKLCAFLRLNMSSKEICAITRQTPNSLNVARARLRKKLGLDNSETSLVSFLEQV